MSMPRLSQRPTIATQTEGNIQTPTRRGDKLREEAVGSDRARRPHENAVRLLAADARQPREPRRCIPAPGAHRYHNCPRRQRAPVNGDAWKAEQGALTTKLD